MNPIHVAQGADDRLRQLAGPVASFLAALPSTERRMARHFVAKGVKDGRFLPPEHGESAPAEMPREGARLLGHAEAEQTDLAGLALAWTMGRIRRGGMSPDEVEDEANAVLATEAGARLFGAALAESAFGAYRDEPDLLGAGFRFDYLPEGSEDDLQAQFATSAAKVVLSLGMVPDMHAAHVHGYRLCGLCEHANRATIDIVFDRHADCPRDDSESFGYDCARASLGLSSHVDDVLVPALSIDLEPVNYEPATLGP